MLSKIKDLSAEFGKHLHFILIKIFTVQDGRNKIANVLNLVEGKSVLSNAIKFSVHTI